MLKPRNRIQAFTKFWIKPYGRSETVTDLARLLEGKQLKLEGSTYRKKKGQVLINWGSTKPQAGIDLNQTDSVSVAVSKMNTFRVLQAAGILVPQWTTLNEEARSWLKKTKVLGRDKDRGSGGDGITVYKEGDVIDPHLFYSRYFRKKREFRIHVFQGRVIFEQEKLKSKGEEVDKYIRSYDNGWVFAWKHLADFPVPASVKDSAIGAVSALSLDFGACDIGWNDNCCVFEVNTAPGLCESSLSAYAKAIGGYYQ